LTLHFLDNDLHFFENHSRLTFNPALITIMRAVLEEAMTKVPAEQATTVTKAYLAEFILKAAAEGLTSYEGLMVAAINQLPIILSMFS
jgi:hypothetical protein